MLEYLENVKYSVNDDTFKPMIEKLKRVLNQAQLDQASYINICLEKEMVLI